ncbi:hypothetical protein CLV35_2170 [Motilibacter peucedani]|uniref:Lipoprotein n=1 Tax=Motilibacter peucedani TaxID=598650 RepID=A0A420XQX3_9ACTN|nr:hypothetical protein [Motilibacter peucedani]RKS75693.1 hypothetical protein CLV35_2170 [Motilibacter peucedani]
MRTTASSTRRRLVAGGAVSLALVGTLTACGSVDDKLAARDAMHNLRDAKAASFTLDLDDPKGELVSVATSADDERAARLAEDAVIRVTIDPAGDTTLGESSKQGATPSPDPVESLKKSGTLELVWSDGSTQVAAVRLVDGVLFARLDPQAWEKATGSALPLDAATAPQFATVVDGLKAGKWLKLDLAGAYAKAKAAGLLDSVAGATGTTPQALDPGALRALGRDLVDAADLTTDVSQDGDKTLVKYQVDVKKSLLAALDVVTEPQYSTLFGRSISASELTQARTSIGKLPDGTPVTGTATVESKHLTRATVDLAGIAKLSQDAKASAITTAKLVVDIDDSPKAVSSPDAGDTVALDTLVDMALAAAKGGMGGAFSGSTGLTG